MRETGCDCTACPAALHQSQLERGVRIVAYWLVTFATLGMQYAFGPIFVMLLEALGGGRGVTALVGSLSVGIMDGLGGIFSGWVVLAIGARRSGLLGAALAALGWGLSALVQESWQLLLSFSCLVGMGHSLGLYAAVMTINRWFSRRLALAHAAGTTGGAFAPFLCGLFAPALAGAVGWRMAMVVFSAVNGTILALAALMLTPPRLSTLETFPETCAVTRCASDSEQGEQMTQAQAHRAGLGNDSEQGEQMTQAQAHRAGLGNAGSEDAGLSELWKFSCLHRQLHLVAFSYFTFGLGCWISVVHVVQLALDQGIPETEASRLTMYLSIGSLTMRVPFGLGADAFGRSRSVAFASVCLCAIHFSAAFPITISSPRFLVGYALSVGGLNGGVLAILLTIPTELDIPRRFVNILSASLSSPLGMGMVAGPPIASVMQERLGSYSPAMLFAASSFAVSALSLYYVMAFTPMLELGKCRAAVCCHPAKSKVTA